MEQDKSLIALDEAIRSGSTAQVCEYLDQVSIDDLQLHSIPALVLLSRPSLLPELANRGVALDAQAFGEVFTRRNLETPGPILDVIDASGIRLELNQPMRASHYYPLDWAIEQKHMAVAHWLVDRGALPCFAYNALNTLLMLDERALFEKLLAAGVDPNSRGIYQKSLWHAMAEEPLSRRAWGIEALRSRQVPQEANSYCRTPRSVAISRYFSEVDEHAQTLPELFALFEGDLWQDHYTRRMVLVDRHWAEIPQLLALAPLPTVQYAACWEELRRSFRAPPYGFIPRAVLLLSQGIYPNKNQWPMILNSFLQGYPAALAELYDKAHPSVRIPWTLGSVIKAADPAVVEAWLVHKGRPEISAMLKATGLLNQTPVDQWQAVVNDLLRQKAPTTQIGLAHAQA